MNTTRRSGLNSTALALIPLAIAINISGGQLVKALRLPIYLDSIGTVLTGALLGPWIGLITGILSNGIWTLIGLDQFAWSFAPVAGAIGLLAGFAGRLGVFQRPSPRWLSAIIAGVFLFALTLFIMSFIYPLHGTPGDYENALPPNDPNYAGSVVIHTDPTFERPYLFPGDPGYEEGGPILGQATDIIAFQPLIFLLAFAAGAALGYAVLQNAGYAGLAGLLTGVVAAIVSAPIAAFLFGGVTGSGTDALVAAFRASGASILASALAQGTVSDPFDKMTSFMVVYLIIQSLPQRLLQRFPNARAAQEPAAATRPATSR
jgi:energy-coupling factor transport system substrate-specific component